MSNSINVYAVELSRVDAIIGSCDQSLIDAIVREHEAFLSSIDDIDSDSELTCADAVADLINGESADDAAGYIYGYASEAIYSHLGETLPNICSVVGASEWLDKVDAVLETNGIPVRLNLLVYRGSPIAIPEPDDYPFIGSWTTEEIAAAKTAFENADMTDSESDMLGILNQVRGWVVVAAKNKDCSIVGFLS